MFIGCAESPTLSAKLLIINELLSFLETRRIPLSALVFFFEMSDMQLGAPLENPIKVKTTDSESVFPSAGRDCQTQSTDWEDVFPRECYG